MIVQRFVEEDLKQIAKLFDEYRSFYNQSSDIQAATQFLEARLLNDESIIFVAKRENKCVGFVQLYPTFSSVAMKRAYILNDLYVTENYRRDGVARMLMEQTFQFAKKHDARFITLETGILNTRAQALYEEMGMEIENTVKHYTYYFE